MSKLLSLVGLMLLIAGCASPIKDANLTQKTTLAPTEGIVAVQIINNAERLSGLHENWTSVTAVRVDNIKQLKAEALEKAKSRAKGKPVDEAKLDWNPEMYSMRPIGAGAIGSQLFVGTMPAGEYIIADLEAYYSDGNMSSWITMQVGYNGGTFLVKPQTLANLGSLVFQPLKSIRQASFWNSNSSQRAYVTRMPQQVDFLPFVQAMYPLAAAQLQAKQTTGWQPDPLMSMRKDLAELSRGNVLLTGAAQGQSPMLFGKLGQLRQQQASGWKTTDLPTNSQVGAVLVTDQFTLVGAEQGEVFMRANSADAWQPLRPVPAVEAVISLVQSGAQFYALTQAEANINVYQFTDPTQPWQVIGTFKTQESGVYIRYGNPWLIASPAGVRVFNDIYLNEYHAAQKNWQTSKTTGLIRMADLGQGVVLGLESSSWDGIGDTLYSTDYGSSWQTLDRSSSFWAPSKFEYSLPVRVGDKLVLIDQVEERSTVNGKQLKQDVLRVTTKAIADAGQKGAWQAAGKAIAGCEILLPEISSAERIYALCEYGKVVSTADLGQSWRTEIHVDIDQMQAKQTAFMLKMLQQLKAEQAKDESAKDEPAKDEPTKDEQTNAQKTN